MDSSVQIVVRELISRRYKKAIQSTSSNDLRLTFNIHTGYQKLNPVSNFYHPPSQSYLFGRAILLVLLQHLLRRKWNFLRSLQYIMQTKLRTPPFRMEKTIDEIDIELHCMLYANKLTYQDLRIRPRMIESLHGDISYISVEGKQHIFRKNDGMTTYGEAGMPQQVFIQARRPVFLVTEKLSYMDDEFKDGLSHLEATKNIEFIVISTLGQPKTWCKRLLHLVSLQTSRILFMFDWEYSGK